MARTLLLWGETQSGKSTLLTTAIYAPEIQDILSASSFASISQNGFFKNHTDLQKNKPIVGTTTYINLNLTFENEFEDLEITDIRGGIVNDPTAQQQLSQVDGVLFVVEWEGRTFAQQIAAIVAIVGAVRGRWFGLAITKAERCLFKDDPAWEAPEGWWMQYDVWRQHSTLMRRFGSNVWPTSSYGYDEEERPAVILGEYGQLLPHNIAPVNTSVPFTVFLQQVAGA